MNWENSSGRWSGSGWTAALRGVIGHFVFQDRYGRPGRGHDKGHFEALAKHMQRPMMTPVPSIAALNAGLER